MSGKAELIEQLTPEQRAAYNYMIGQDQKGLITVFTKPDRELTDTKFINPGHSDQQGIVNTGNNQPLASGPTHTGNSDGLVNKGGTSTVTPLPDGSSKDDLAYLDRPANLSPQGSARAGAFNEAKRQSGIPVSQSPSNVYPNVDKRLNPQPGYIYEFDVPKPGGGKQKV